MNKLKRDIKLCVGGQLAVVAGLVGLGLFKLVQILCGLGEQEMYKQYPASWWVVVSLGLIFIAGLIYSVRKTVDIHPNIQLRSKPDDVLEKIIADPEYRPWHQEAQRLLDQRKGTQPEN